MFRNFLPAFSGFNQRSEIDDLLDNEDTTLEQVLSENEVVNEIKVNNKRLIEFFTRDKIIKLIHYIIDMPEESDEHDRMYKFPFVASEILSSDSPALLDMFFKSEINRKNIPADNDKLFLLTLKFKKEALEERRERKKFSDSGAQAENVEVQTNEAEPEDGSDVIPANTEEPRQGNSATLGNHNAEVL